MDGILGVLICKIQSDQRNADNKLDVTCDCEGAIKA
jgi:hypothetical protein